MCPSELRLLFISVLTSLMYRFARPLTVDLRGLALMRCLLGLLIILDAAVRCTDLLAHYTDVGVLPRNILLTEIKRFYQFSFLQASGQPLWVAIFLLTYGISGFALALGWKTRWSTLLAWILLLSLHNRNPLILNAGDSYFRMLLFWSLFLPLGARFSVDRACSRETSVPSGNQGEHQVITGGSVALVLQVGLLYFCSAVLKTSPEWWPEGSATWYALSLEQFTTPVGDWLRNFSNFLQGLTWGVYGLEWLTPVLLLCPFWFPWVRTLGLILLIGMHLGFVLTMEFGLFAWICIAPLIALLPREVWDWLASRNWACAKSTAPLILYYDQDCGFCRRMVGLLQELMLFGCAEIRTIQGTSAVHALFEYRAPNSWVVQSGEHYFFAGEGLWVMLHHSPWTGWFLNRMPELSTPQVLEGFYSWVAEHRSQLGRWTSWLGWRSQAPAAVPHWYLSLTALLLALLVVGYNLRYSFFADVPLPKPISILFQTLRLDQRWSMFAPRPNKDDGWYVMTGELVDGTPVDVYRQQIGEVSFAKPADPSAFYPNQRWRKYLMNLWRKKYKDYRLPYGRYLCRSWNRSVTDPNRKLPSFQIYFLLEKPNLPGLPPQPAKRRTVWRHKCF